VIGARNIGRAKRSGNSLERDQHASRMAAIARDVRLLMDQHVLCTDGKLYSSRTQEIDRCE
jgi:hypothetical protein